MRRFQSILGTIWAAAALPVVLAGFFGMNTLSKGFVSATGLQVSPWFTGGEAVRSVNHGTWQTIIHRPVFDGLFRQRPSGFVQIDWKPVGEAKLPARIEEEVDLDGDGAADVRVAFDTVTNHAQVTSLDQRPVSLRETFDPGGWRAVRLNVRNPKRR